MTNPVSVLQLGIMDYEAACHVQEELAAARARGAVEDLLLLVQHPPVITVGRAGGWEDILVPSWLLKQQGIRVLPTDRGGKATYHGPGQLVAYPIFKVSDDDLYRFVRRLEEVVIRLLRTFDLAASRLEKHPGVWVNGNKIAALGLAVSEGVTRHGLALNVAPQLAHFDLFIPCGIADRGVTSMEQELGRGVDMAEVMRLFVQTFGQVFGRQVAWEEPSVPAILPLPSLLVSERQPEEVQPPWLWQRVTPEAEAATARMADLIADLRLHTVCQEARCPNIAECFEWGTATLMILGDTCTRACRFCAVRRGQPAPLDASEPERAAEAAARLRLEHVVITSVTRDDLPDGGAGQFAETIRAVRRRLAEARVEVLIPDLDGSDAALGVVLAAEPDVLNHNVETVPRLYSRVRPQADYRRSLAVLARTKALLPRIVTKSGLMLGLGERTAEVVEVLHDLRQAQCDLLTLGQYLSPTDAQLPVARYVPPEEFDWYKEKAEALGFQGVASGPLVRSSYRAEAIMAENAQPLEICPCES
ncbi:MAG TPA: lipoyl synthase [Anaerolineae bacterium]|nr:lipoyl synthase [Anaerolineae bacterium]